MFRQLTQGVAQPSQLNETNQANRTGYYGASSFGSRYGTKKYSSAAIQAIQQKKAEAKKIIDEELKAIDLDYEEKLTALGQITQEALGHRGVMISKAINYTIALYEQIHEMSNITGDDYSSHGMLHKAQDIIGPIPPEARFAGRLRELKAEFIFDTRDQSREVTRAMEIKNREIEANIHNIINWEADAEKWSMVCNMYETIGSLPTENQEHVGEHYHSDDASLQ